MGWLHKRKDDDGERCQVLQSIEALQMVSIVEVDSALTES
jgi:hypothetical protein